jgi:hypothetical protein
MLLVLCLVLGLSAASSAASREAAPTLAGERLPGALIAYTYLSSNYVSFRQFLEGDSEFEWRIEFRRLEASLEKLDCDLARRSSFVRFAFTIQGDTPGQEAGFRRFEGKTLEESHVPFDGVLYVTSPLQAIGGKIVVIMSSVSPERTTAFTIDEQLGVNLLYDSYKAVSSGTVIPMGSVYRVRVQNPGLFMLDERMILGGRGHFSATDNRRFLLDVMKGSLTPAK